MIFETILTLAMTFAGEVKYNSPERLKESYYIYQVAKNRARICNTSIKEELLKKNMFSAQNDSNCKKGSKSECLKITKYNIDSYAKRLEDTVKILLYPGSINDITFYHADYITLYDTGQNEHTMKFKKKVGNHLFYSSTDTNFCKAKHVKYVKYVNRKKINNNLIVHRKKQPDDPLTIYRKKLKKLLE